jgi:hypothetical protein
MCYHTIADGEKPHGGKWVRAKPTKAKAGKQPGTKTTLEVRPDRKVGKPESVLNLDK